MQRLKEINEFFELRDKVTNKRKSPACTVVIPAGTCGQASGANDLIRAAKKELLDREHFTNVALRVTGCHGFCELEPSLLIEPQGIFYPKVDPKEMKRILEASSKGEVIEELLWKHPSTGEPVAKQIDIPFFKRQTRTIIARNEKVDPIRIYQYVENGGYKNFVSYLKMNKPEKVVEEIKLSGLRGRGGAGFPTGVKWEMLSKQPGENGKYLICNADEGDPGAYMDRSVLEGNPHSIIEGMLVGAFATGANRGVVYVRAEYPLAIKHLTIAMRQAEELGLLGDNILGTGFSFELRLIKGAGAFVCGEETALIASIEGKMGEPKQRPPFPIERGVFGCPTSINNVETWANITEILEKGASDYASVGTPGNSGTKIFSLVGKIKNTGLVEVPMGTTIREIIYDIGGGSIGNAKIKAVQTGGPSGGCIPSKKFDLPIDYDTLAKAGSIMGSGGMIVMDENTCMVDLAKYYMNFLRDESCGKCYTCRKGTQRMYEILDDISRGESSLEQLKLLEDLANVVADTTMCGLGQTAPNPVRSTLKYYRAEFIEHIMDKKCRAGACTELVGAPCHSTCPIDTEAWRYVAHIARGEYEDAYKAIRETNPFPSICARVCDHKCEEKCKLGQQGNRSVAIRSLKRFVTDNVDPSIYEPQRSHEVKTEKIAIIGSGPAGLSAAHYLSLNGYRSTVFEMDNKAGGMLQSCIPAYRLPREVLNKEIDAIFDENVELKTKTTLGKDITINGLLEDGYSAVFLGVGAQKGRRLKLEGEDSKGVYPSIEFLKAYNMEGDEWASGRVGVVGGGNSAVDAARTALRQSDVENVTLLYRRTREEMPAFGEEIEAAGEEKISLETLVTPTRIITKNGKLVGIECIRNELGEVDFSGRRSPVPIPGSEFTVELDTLIVAISEQPDVNSVSPEGVPEIKINEWGTIEADENTLACSKKGVFAGGDVVTGPNTVVDAIAAGKKAAIMIDRYLKGEPLRQEEKKSVPEIYIEPIEVEQDVLDSLRRAEPPKMPVDKRQKNFDEVEKTFIEDIAKLEASRCLRCDLDFTQCKHKVEQLLTQETEGQLI